MTADNTLTDVHEGHFTPEVLADRLRAWADRVGRDPKGTPCDEAITAWEALVEAATALRALSTENERLRARSETETIGWVVVRDVANVATVVSPTCMTREAAEALCEDWREVSTLGAYRVARVVEEDGDV